MAMCGIAIAHDGSGIMPWSRVCVWVIYHLQSIAYGGAVQQSH